MDKNNTTIVPKNNNKTLEQFFHFYDLSSLLFDRNKDEIYNVTDIPKDSKFHEEAQKMASQLGIDWNKMSHEESNRIMLAMLEDSFNLIRDIEKAPNIILKVKLQITKRQ